MTLNGTPDPTSPNPLPPASPVPTGLVAANPTGTAGAISSAVKTVLLALIATGVLPWDDAQVTAIGLAVSTVVDLALIFGLIRPRVTPVANPKSADGVPLVPVTSRPLGLRPRN